MKTIILFVLMSVSLQSFSQCEILNRLLPDETMLYYMQPVVFYWTSAKELKGCVVTDKENYFVGLRPRPFPDKSQGNKLKEDLEIKLANDKIYRLSHYDTRYTENDTVVELLYLIDKKELDDFLNFEVLSAKINMKGDEGMRTYVFKLHKKALMEQLACFLKEYEHKK